MMHRPLSPHVKAQLSQEGLDPDSVQRLVTTALDEDLRYGADITTEVTVPAEATAIATINARRPGIVAGLSISEAVFDTVLGSNDYEVTYRARDGEHLMPGQPALRLSGRVRGLLTAERTALNFLTHLSGIATLTAEWVRAIAGTGCAIRDSRKTSPGLRSLEKYAVRCGGGINHRFGLGDAVLIKDNHIIAAGSAIAALRLIREKAPDLPCEIEVTSLAEFYDVLAAEADEILLDNFTVEDCTEACRRRDVARSSTRLEASGGLRLDHARRFAETGVDYLAVGALTHSAPALDLGMDLESGSAS